MNHVALNSLEQTGLAPVWAQDAVMSWARENGCAPGTIHWNALMKCWEVNLALKEADPRLMLWQEGKLTSKPTEVVFLHAPTVTEAGKRPRLVGLNIEDLGVAGLRGILDRGNVMSGRGEFPSLMEAVRSAASRNEQAREAKYKDADNVARDNARERRRSVLGLPVLPVGIDLKGEA